VADAGLLGFGVAHSARRGIRVGASGGAAWSSRLRSRAQRSGDDVLCLLAALDAILRPFWRLTPWPVATRPRRAGVPDRPPAARCCGLEIAPATGWRWVLCSTASDRL